MGILPNLQEALPPGITVEGYFGGGSLPKGTWYELSNAGQNALIRVIDEEQPIEPFRPNSVPRIARTIEAIGPLTTNGLLARRASIVSGEASFEPSPDVTMRAEISRNVDPLQVINHMAAVILDTQIQR
jgi:hypothetical protein